MAFSDEDLGIAASIVKFFNDSINSGKLEDDAKESLNVAVDCINNVFSLVGGEKVVSLVEAYRNAVKTAPVPKEASEADKKRAEELKNEGNNLLKIGKLDEAVTAYTKAIELDGNNAIYYSNRAAVHLKLGNNQGALDDCDRALQLDPNYSKAFCRKGVAHMNKGENRIAKECFQKAAEIEPENETYRNNLKVVDEKINAEERNPLGGDQFGGMFPGMGGGMGGMFPGMDAMFSNPGFMEMATRVMQDPSMQQMMSSVVGNLMGGDPGSMGAPPPGSDPGPAAGEHPPGAPDFSSILRMGQQFAQQMASANPDLVEELRRQTGGQGPGSNPGSDPKEAEKRGE